VVQTVVRGPCAGGAVDGAAGCVHADGDVGVHGVHAGIVQDEVRVVVVEPAFVLEIVKGNKKYRFRKQEKQGNKKMRGNTNHEGRREDLKRN